MSEGSGCKVQLTLAQKDVNIWNLEKTRGLNAFLLKEHLLQQGYLQAQKDQVTRHSDVLVDPGGSPGTFQNST